jgi:hypothetical protein
LKTLGSYFAAWDSHEFVTLFAKIQYFDIYFRHCLRFNFMCNLKFVFSCLVIPTITIAYFDRNCHNNVLEHYPTWIYLKKKLKTHFEKNCKTGIRERDWELTDWNLSMNKLTKRNEFSSIRYKNQQMCNEKENKQKKNIT